MKKACILPHLRAELQLVGQKCTTLLVQKNVTTFLTLRELLPLSLRLHLARSTLIYRARRSTRHPTSAITCPLRKGSLSTTRWTATWSDEAPPSSLAKGVPSASRFYVLINTKCKSRADFSFSRSGSSPSKVGQNHRRRIRTFKTAFLLLYFHTFCCLPASFRS